MNYVVYGQEITLFKLPHTKFQRLVYTWQTLEVSMAAVVVKMEKNEFCSVIKHFYLKKWTAAQIKTELDEVHGDSAPALKTVYFWSNKFKRGWTSTKNEARPGRPVEVITPEMIEKFHRIVENRRMKVRDIVQLRL